MAKTKKIVKLGLGVIENLINSSQWDKIDTMVRQEKFSEEAVRYLLDKRGASAFWTVKAHYKFEDLYSSFEDYINSKVALDLFEDGDSGHVFDWLGDFPKNSDELMELYNKQDTDLVRAILFKNSIYRERIIRMNLDIRERYLNCFDAILEITKREYNPSDIEALTYIMTWSQYVSKEWGAKIENLIGKEEAARVFLRRLEMKRNYFGNPRGLYDIAEIYDYLSSLNPVGISIDALVRTLSAFDWDYSMTGEQQADFIKRAKPLYNKFIRPRVVEDLKSVYAVVNGDPSKIHAVVYTFEDEEEVIDKVFSWSCKRNSLQGAAHEIIFLQRKNINAPITPFIEKLSKTIGRDWSEVFLTKEIKTAKELLDLKDQVFPFVQQLEPFYTSPCVCKNIRLDEFSVEDIEILSPYIKWRNINRYFQGELAPFEFIMRNRDRIAANGFNFSIIALGKYTPKQLVEVLETFSNSIDDFTKERIVSHCCSSPDALSIEDVARILKYTNAVDFLTGSDSSTKSKIDLQSVLTLI